MNDAQTYYGKYRGTVLNNIDPMQMGRLQVQVPDVAGLIPTSWAMPCFSRRREADGRVHAAADRLRGVGGV
jgi:hypothetical protein